MGQTKEAAQAAENVIELNKNHARAHIIIADHNRRSGRLKDALSHYRISAQSLDTRAYAEYYIDVLTDQLEEKRVEQEYQENR